MPESMTTWFSVHFDQVLVAVQVLATLGLVFFAGVQLRLQSRNDRNRKRAAYASMYGEYWRLYSLSDWWNKNDIVQAAKLGFLNRGMFDVTERITTLRTLAEVSSGAAAFGGWAYDHLQRAAEKAQLK